ncbi:NAD(P)-dependent oxidoreductase [Marmoricola endophyticus]|uniref:NAD(P)-dependent oxidoreductase n=1 Tax=Marmoricola endophyticus TaxID=2040280 RepID=A0A917F8H8_9ACTN|nr:NAD(P)H-binding protein [Marmoricola endophyticus]GGF55491.1 NAD(P)-dependent oxidoreductase [Marmoricola endophyticus]
MTLTLTGSTGHLGRLVLDRLPGQVDRLVVRDASRAPAGPESRVTTYGDRETAVAALRGTDVLLMVSGAESPTRRDEHRTFIAAAAEAGVGHVVYTSFLGAAPDAGFTLGRDHFDAEQAIRESGMEWTLLRDNFYTEVLPLFADDDGVVAGPAGQGRLAAVARADVADVAAAVLSDAPAHAGATYSLTGPEALTLAEATARMTQLLGRPYSYREETLEEAYASRRRWTDEQWQLDAWVSTYTAIADGECARVTDDVRRVTGHDARTLEEALGNGR